MSLSIGSIALKNSYSNNLNSRKNNNNTSFKAAPVPKLQIVWRGQIVSDIADFNSVIADIARKGSKEDAQGFLAAYKAAHPEMKEDAIKRSILLMAGQHINFDEVRTVFEIPNPLDALRKTIPVK